MNILLYNAPILRLRLRVGGMERMGWHNERGLGGIDFVVLVVVGEESCEYYGLGNGVGVIVCKGLQMWWYRVA